MARVRLRDCATTLHQYASQRCTSRTHANVLAEHALILLSDNGKNDLSNLNFDNFFARSYDKSGVIWYTASIVVTAVADYRIRHSIVATRSGTSKTAAFQLLMLDVETKLDAVLRGNGLNTGGLPIKYKKAKESKEPTSTVSIISTPAEAMAPPQVKVEEDHTTWSGCPLSSSPKSKVGTLSSHSSKGSHGTQASFASSKYSQDSKVSQSTAPSDHTGALSSKPSHQSFKAFSASTAPTPKQYKHVRHASTPMQPPARSTTPTPKSKKHCSQPLQPRSASTPPTPVIKALPALPAIEKPTVPIPAPSEPELIHPALRSKGHSTEGLKPPSRTNTNEKEKTPSVAGSSVYSRSPISPMDDAEKEVHVQPLNADPEIPSPLHFEKAISTKPARFLRSQTEFEIYA